MIFSPFELMIGGLGESNEQLSKLFDSDPTASATAALASRASGVPNIRLSVRVNVWPDRHTAHSAATLADIRDVNLDFHNNLLK
ncbi:MAG: hypothetical protein NTW32_27450 [Chloroflexi bacterium]|nr:hypothetical protein [Chloroflexota bacterium]